MAQSDPITALAAALHGAANLYLPPVEYEAIDYSALPTPSVAEFKKTSRPTIRKVRRPFAHECTVIAMFSQTWGSTALGFGGWGGAAITDAYTIAIQGPGRDIVVYWGPRFAFLIPGTMASREQVTALFSDLKSWVTVPRCDATARYGATWPTGDL